MDEHTRQLGEALTAIIDAIEANEISREENLLRKVVDKPRILRLDDLVSDKPDDGSSYVRDPVGEALRAGLRNFGKIIAGIKTTDEMLEIAEFAAGEERFQWRINVIDKNWDGIADKDGGLWIA